MMQLPSPIPVTEWREVTPELERTKAYWPAIRAAALAAARKPGWNPRTVQMAGHMLAIDYSFRPGADRVSAYKVAIIQDHQILAALPKHAPRAVRHIYRKDVRLKYLRAADGWDFLADWERAQEAWEKFQDERP